jgi:Protein of unknown function (DUF2971)
MNELASQYHGDDAVTLRREPNPSTLYHYASIDNFKKIIASGRIRASRYDQLNDTTEIQFGVDKLLEAVHNHQVVNSLLDYKAFLIAGIEGYKETLDVYLLSLSSAADSLDQWRAYAPRGGVAIGFDFELVSTGFLCDITSRIGGIRVNDPIRPDPSNRLMRCEYADRNGNIDLRSIVADRFFQSHSYPAMFALQEAGASKYFHASLSTMIYRTICSIKHGAFASEAEWRCVNYRPNRGHYPVGTTEMNRSFIELAFDPATFVKEVWISPHGDKAECDTAVRNLRQRDNLRFAIMNSMIPFRG